MSSQSLRRHSVVVTLENGLHLVPCSLIAQTVRRHDCEVRIRNGANAVDARNVIDLMTLKADCGVTLELEARGAAADDVIDELVRLFESNFAQPAAARADTPGT